MTGDKPKVFASVKLAWSDVFRVIADMPALTWSAVVLGLIFGGVGIVLEHWTGTVPSSLGALAATSAIRALWIFFLTPLYLAIHRYIILGEITPRYALAPEQPRFQRFFLFTLALYALWIVPSLVVVTFGHTGVALGVMGILMLVGVFVSTRLIVLFPAVAVDAPGAGFRNAFDDTRGFFWRIFGIALVTILPVLIVVVPAILALGEQSIIAKLFGAVVNMLTLALAIAVASRLYLRLGDRLGRPGPGAVEFGAA